MAGNGWQRIDCGTGVIGPSTTLDLSSTDGQRSIERKVESVGARISRFLYSVPRRESTDWTWLARARRADATFLGRMTRTTLASESRKGKMPRADLKDAYLVLS